MYARMHGQKVSMQHAHVVCILSRRSGVLTTMDNTERTWEWGGVHGREVAGVPARLAPHHALHADAEVHRRRGRGQAAQHGGGAAAQTTEEHGGEGQQHALVGGQSHRVVVVVW